MFSTRPGSPSKGVRIFLAAFFLVAALLITYSQTRAFVWDEGFHLVAAGLIAQGKTPYIDFCFPQTPINAYFNAALVRVYGQDWHAPHLLAALFVVGAMFLTAQFLVTHLPAGKPRWTAAICAIVFLGLNTTVMQFGTVAQAYGSGMFFGVAAFRAAASAVRRQSALLAFAAGLLAGVAAGCSLLTAPVAVVLLLWGWWNNQAGNRWQKCAAFLAGAAIPFAPVLRLFLEAPPQLFFNIVQYQALYRRVNWPGATLHDVGVMTSWLDSPQALFVGLLALAGVWRMLREPAWGPEFRLPAWLCLGLGLCIAVAHPTFERYFIFLVPFASILAVVGLLGFASRRVAPIAVTLFALSCGRRLFEDRDATTWKTYETVVRKVAEVTPPGAALYAEELVYFRMGRTPPTGLEFSYTRNLQLAADREKSLHVVSQAEFKEQIKAGRFATVQSCKDDLIEYYQLSSVFPHQADVEDCSVFWGKVKTGE